jgi:hypothetical protein
MNMIRSDLFRNKHDCFEDNDLAELLVKATETKAGSPGGKAVPDWAREREIQKIKHAREANVCTLNEFRRHLGLKGASMLTLTFPLSYRPVYRAWVIPRVELRLGVGSYSK